MRSDEADPCSRTPTCLPVGWKGFLREVDKLDRDIYAAIGRTPASSLDKPLRLVSSVADHGLLWFGVSAVLSFAGGQQGRRAAGRGLAALASASLIANLVLKFAGRRARPDRAILGVPEERCVRMPSSPSFPSGHSASAFAFATAASRQWPLLAVPLRALAGLVAYSRVHTGVHYPSDVVVGALLGSAVGRLVGAWAGKVVSRAPCPATEVHSPGDPVSCTLRSWSRPT